MSHTLSKIVALVVLASPLPAHADGTFQVVGPDSAIDQMALAVAQVSLSPARALATTIDQAGSGLRELVQAPLAATARNAAFVEQAAGLANSAMVSTDQAGNTALIEQFGQSNTAIVEQTGLLNASLIMQSGAGNDCTVTQSSNGNLSTVTQTGSNGFVSVRQG